MKTTSLRGLSKIRVLEFCNLVSPSPIVPHLYICIAEWFEGHAKFAAAGSSLGTSWHPVLSLA